MSPHKCFSGWYKSTLVTAVTIGAVGGAACSVYIYRKCLILLRELESAAQKGAEARNEPLPEQQAPESQTPDEREPRTLPLLQPHQSKYETQDKLIQKAPRPGFAGLAQPCLPSQQHCTHAQTATTAPVPKRRSTEQNENTDVKIFLAALLRHHPYFYHYGDRCKHPLPVSTKPVTNITNSEPSAPSPSQQEEQQRPPTQTSRPSSTPQLIEGEQQQQEQQQEQPGSHPSSSQHDVGLPVRSLTTGITSPPSLREIQPPQLPLQTSAHQTPEGPSQSPPPQQPGALPCQPQQQQPGSLQVQQQFQHAQPQIQGLSLPGLVDGHEMSAREVNPRAAAGGPPYYYQPPPLSPYHQHPQHFPVGFGRIQVAQAQTATIAPVARVAIVNQRAASPANPSTTATIRAEPAGMRKRHIPAGGSDRQLHRATTYRRRRRLTSATDSSDSMASQNSARSHLRSFRHLYFNRGQRQLQIQSMRRRTPAAALHGSQRQLLQLQQHLETKLQVQQLLLSREGSQDKFYRGRERAWRRTTTALTPTRNHPPGDGMWGPAVGDTRDVGVTERPVQEAWRAHPSPARAKHRQQQPKQQQREYPPSPQQSPLSSPPQRQTEDSQGSDEEGELPASPFMSVQRPQGPITHHMKRSAYETTTFSARSLSHQISGAMKIHTNDLYVTPSHTDLVTAEHRPPADAIDAVANTRGCLRAHMGLKPITLPQHTRQPLQCPGRSASTPRSSGHSGDEDGILASQCQIPIQPPRPTRREVVMLLGFDVRREAASQSGVPPGLAYAAACAFAVAAAAAVTAAVATATAATMRDITGVSGDGATAKTSGSATLSCAVPGVVLPCSQLVHQLPCSVEAVEPKVTLTPQAAYSRQLVAQTQDALADRADNNSADYSGHARVTTALATASGGASAAASSLRPAVTTTLRSQTLPSTTRPHYEGPNPLYRQPEPPPASRQQIPLPEGTWSAAATAAAAAIATDDSGKSYSPAPGSLPPSGLQGRATPYMMPDDTHPVTGFGMDPVSGFGCEPPNAVKEQRDRLAPVPHSAATGYGINGSTVGTEVGSSRPDDVGKMFWPLKGDDGSPLYDLTMRCTRSTRSDGVIIDGVRGGGDGAPGAAAATASAVAVAADGGDSGPSYNINKTREVAAAPVCVGSGVARAVGVAAAPTAPMGVATVARAGDRGGAVPSTPPTPLQVVAAAAVTSNSGMTSKVHGSRAAAAAGSPPFDSMHINRRTTTTMAASPQPHTQTPPTDRSIAAGGHVAPTLPPATVEALPPAGPRWHNMSSKGICNGEVAGASVSTATDVRRSADREDGTREAMNDAAPVLTPTPRLAPRIISPRSVLSRSTAAAVPLHSLQHLSASAKTEYATVDAILADSARVRSSRTLSQPRSLLSAASGCASIRSNLSAQALLHSSFKKASGTAVSAAMSLSPLSPPLPLRPSLTTGGVVPMVVSPPSISSHALSTPSYPSKSLAPRSRASVASHSATSRHVSASGSIASSTVSKERMRKPSWVNPASPARTSQPATAAAATAAEHQALKSTPRSRLLARYAQQEVTDTSGLGRGHGHSSSSCPTGGLSLPSFMSPTAASRAKARTPVPSHAGALRSENAEPELVWGS